MSKNYINLFIGLFELFLIYQNMINIDEDNTDGDILLAINKFREHNNFI